jgi:ribosomal protein S18 acetylase RimI-like enzyme
MSTDPDLHLRWAADEDARAVARLSKEIDPDMDETQAGLVELFLHSPPEARRTMYLAWQADRPVARVRFKSAGALAWAWGIGWLPAWAAEGGTPAPALAGPALAGLVRALEAQASAAGARRLTVELLAPQVAAFAAAGYRPSKRRVEMAAPLVRRPVICDRPLRPPRPDDPAEREALARLLYEGYLGSVDQDGETEEVARAETAHVLDGEYAPFLAGCSMLIEGDGGLAGAALILREGRSLSWLAEIVVHRGCRGRGYGRALVQAAMNAGLDQGYEQMGLVVTLGNVPAEGLYRRLGFREEGEVQHHYVKEIA